MEDMRTVLMDEDAVLIVVVVGIAANMRALINEEHFFASIGGQIRIENSTGLCYFKPIQPRSALIFLSVGLHQCHHSLPGQIPRHCREERIHLLLPRSISSLAQGDSDSVFPFARRIGNLHQAQLTIGPHYIANRRANHGLSPQVLGVLV